MAEDRWRRTSVPTEAAASAALRLTEEYSYAKVVRRDRPDGAIEVVGIHDGRLDHYVVHGNGAIERVATQLPSATNAWGRRIAKAGLIGLSLALVATFFARDEILVWVFVAAAAAAFMGRFMADGKELEAYLLDQSCSDEGWTRMPYELGGWPPRSSTQLETAKALSDDGEGFAHVRNRNDGLVEVVTTRGNLRYTHLVDDVGEIVEEMRRPLPAAQHWAVGLACAGPLVWIATLALADSILVSMAGPVVCAVCWVVAVLLDVRSRRMAGEGWSRLQTKITD